MLIHHRYANATQVLLCKSNWQKMENTKNMEYETNNNYTPWGW